MIKNRKKAVNEYVQAKRVTAEVWEECFRKLYDAEDTQMAEGYQTASSATVTEMETRARLKTLKNRKAPGTDHIPNELLKYGGLGLAAGLTTLFNKILSTTEIPKDLHSSISIPIYKKGKNKT